MNENFANYSTGIAFCIQLTKLQCNALLELESYNDKKNVDPFYMIVHTVGTLQSLEARGFVQWIYTDNKPSSFKGLTEAGRLMVQLLKEAGLNTANTATVSVLKRKAARAA